MIVEGHGVSHYFKALVETAVVLAVNVFCVAVSDAKDIFSIFIVFACTVDFELYSEISRAFAVEDWLGFKIVVLNAVAAAVSAIA